MPPKCTSGQQAFVGGYVLLGCLFIVSVVHESTKLVHRYRNSNTFTTTPKHLLSISLLFIWISMLSIMKCILYGLLQCHYINISKLLENSPLGEFFEYLYVIQLYVLWIVILFRLYFSLSRTPFQCTYCTIITYSSIMILYPFLFILTLSPSLHSVFIVSSFSLSVFITLSIMILYGFKSVQIHRFSDYQNAKQYRRYITIHGLDPLEIMTKHSILVLTMTISSFIMLFALISIFILNSIYQMSMNGEQQILDLCVLLHPYITSICVLLQFKYLHSNYLYRCSFIHYYFNIYCDKFLVNEIGSTINTIDIQDHVCVELNAANDNNGNNDEIYEIVSDSDDFMSPKPSTPPSDIINKNDNDMMYNPPNAPLRIIRTHASTASNNADKSVERMYLDVPDSVETDKMMKEWVSNDSSNALHSVLIKRGFDSSYAKRGIMVYEKHYGMTDYDLDVIGEIIYRLTIKDKVKQFKSVRNTYESPDSIHSILSSLNFSDRYINLALMLYSVTVEMFNINENGYDLELITEIVMRLRSKFTEHGDLIVSDSADQLSSDYRLQQFNNQISPRLSSDINTEPHSSDEESDENGTFTFETRMNTLRIENNASILNIPQRIEQEILDTEIKYIDDLHILMDEFISPIFDNGLLDEGFRKEITSIIPQLIIFHESFYAELMIGSIADVFNKESDYFKMYISYISSYRNILSIFASNRSNKKLNTFLENKRKENKVLISYLILPIQRIPRYLLLLSELKNKSKPSAVSSVTSALHKVKAICNQINEKQREIENMSQCTLISSKLKGLNQNIVEPQRKYINNFIFKHKTNEKKTQFFVFNDIVIIANIKWKTEEMVSLMDFDAQKPNINQVKIRIKDNDPIYFISINDCDNKQSDVDLFVSTISKYRTLLYELRLSRTKALESELRIFQVNNTASPISPQYGATSPISPDSSTNQIISNEYARIKTLNLHHLKLSVDFSEI